MKTDFHQSGGCQCGKIRYVLKAPPKTLYACHCRDCQKQSSSAFGMSLIMDPANIDFVAGEAQLKTWDTHGDNGGLKRCAFCPDCGTRILHATADPDAPVSIKAGSLDDSRWLHPIAHIWLSSAQPWVSIDDRKFHCFDREPEDQTELTRLWQDYVSDRGGF